MADVVMVKSHILDCDLMEKAEILATLVTSVDTDHRYLLYQIAATHFAKVGQGFQASHFRTLANLEMGGR